MMVTMGMRIVVVVERLANLLALEEGLVTPEGRTTERGWLQLLLQFLQLNPGQSETHDHAYKMGWEWKRDTEVDEKEEGGRGHSHTVIS